MNHDTRSSGKPVLTILSVIGFVGSMIGLLVDVTEVLGLSAQLQNVGQKALVAIAGVAVFYLLRRLHSGVIIRCLKNELRLRRLRRQLFLFQDRYDARPFDDVVNIAEIDLVKRFKQTRLLHCQVKELAVLDPLTGSTQDRLRLTVDKGRVHGLAAGMTLAVHAIDRGDALFAVELRDGRGGNALDPWALLGLRNTSIVFPLEDSWGLSLGEVTRDWFDVRLIQPPDASVINKFVGSLCWEIDRDWDAPDALREMRRLQE